MAYTARVRTTKQIRNGVGHRAYRREAARLKRKTKERGLPCHWCGKPIDCDLPSTDRWSFTADHPEAIAAGGKLVGQRLEPFHRCCNSSKNDNVDVIIRDAT